MWKHICVLSDHHAQHFRSIFECHKNRTEIKFTWLLISRYQASRQRGPVVAYELVTRGNYNIELSSYKLAQLLVSD